MDSALLQNLMAGTGSSGQFIGGLVVALLYVVIGLLSAIGSILIFRRICQGRWEQIFWASFLVVIAAFYLSFAAYFEASTHAWQTEVIGVAVFFVCAVGGLFSRSAIAVGYVMHGLWDLSHCLWGSSFAGLSITEIPLPYPDDRTLPYRVPPPTPPLRSSARILRSSSLLLRLTRRRARCAGPFLYLRLFIVIALFPS